MTTYQFDPALEIVDGAVTRAYYLAGMGWDVASIRGDLGEHVLGDPLLRCFDHVGGIEVLAMMPRLSTPAALLLRTTAWVCFAIVLCSNALGAALRGDTLFVDDGTRASQTDIEVREHQWREVMPGIASRWYELVALGYDPYNESWSSRPHALVVLGIERGLVGVRVVAAGDTSYVEAEAFRYGAVDDTVMDSRTHFAQLIGRGRLFWKRRIPLPEVACLRLVDWAATSGEEMQDDDRCHVPLVGGFGVTLVYGDGDKQAGVSCLSEWHFHPFDGLTDILLGLVGLRLDRDERQVVGVPLPEQ